MSSSGDMEAPPRSMAGLEILANTVRQVIDHEEIPFFPVAQFLEFGLNLVAEDFVFDIRPYAEMGRRMGAVNQFERLLMLRSDVYDKLCLDDPRARFTAAHEIGHALMHVGTLNRVEASRIAPIAPFRDPEWQANYFAAALLMPRRLFVESPSINKAMVSFGVSRRAAELRAQKIGLIIP